MYQLQAWKLGSYELKRADFREVKCGQASLPLGAEFDLII